MPGVMSYLSEQVTAEEGEHLYERFLWELRREREPRQALDLARFAMAYGPNETPELSQALDALKSKIAREPRLLDPGQHLALSPGLEVVNLSDRSVAISGAELLLAKEQALLGGGLTVVVDDHPASAKSAEGQTIWNLPVSAEDAEDSWRSLLKATKGAGPLPTWVEAVSNHRHLVGEGSLPSEHLVRALRTRDFVKEVLLEHAYGPSTEQMAQLTDDEVEWVIEQLDFFFEHYTHDPRLALSCKGLDDFSPLTDWQQHGPSATAALLASVTGDDGMLTGALKAADRMRIGSLAFTGDPDSNGDDLLSAVLPPQECAVVLKPEVLDHTLFFAGMPHPGADLPVPQRRHGFYNTLAIGGEVRDMLRTRAYLGMTPASPDSVRDYFQGRSQEIQLEETTANPAFQALVTAVMIRRRQGEDNPMVRAALRVAAAHSIYVGLSRDPSQDALGGVHLGALGLGDIEQVVVPLLDSDEWRRYHHSGQLPSRLKRAEDFLGEFGIRLRGRAPVGHGSMAVGS